MAEIIVITGTTRGLGYSKAKIFLSMGYTVYGLNRSSSENLDKLKDTYPNTFHNIEVNVTNEEEIKEAATRIDNKHGKVDILINNAAVHSSIAEPAETSKPVVEDLNFNNIEHDIQINSIAPLKIIKHFLPLIRAGDRKLIVNISSEAGSITNAWREKEFGYCMSKSALNMASKILQNYVKKENIKVLAIHPGWFSSDMGGSNAPITPDTAAQHVIDVILQNWTVNDPIFLDAKDGTSILW